MPGSRPARWDAKPSAATDIQMRAQILSYSRARGLFAGITLNGATIRQDRDANERFYGTAYRTGQIVFEGLAGAPAVGGDVERGVSEVREVNGLGPGLETWA